ncbi:MAG TPA: PHP domain-containing protein, partial [Rectinema sp.]|nr:PHP domain-containing protein [Rectinema sp.]
MLYTFDFHNHSCLSPCASLEASPSEMVEWAIKKRIDLFALTDHNSALNSPAFGIECANAGIIPLFGIELNPFEEAHLLAIFSDPLTALRFSDWVFEYLPAMRVDPLQFGDQVVVDPLGQILSMPSSTWYGSSLKESFTFFAEEAA